MKVAAIPALQSLLEMHLRFGHFLEPPEPELGARFFEFLCVLIVLAIDGRDEAGKSRRVLLFEGTEVANDIRGRRHNDSDGLPGASDNLVDGAGHGVDLR